jgi:hypothetical protein
MQEVKCQSEIRNQLRSADQKEQDNNTMPTESMSAQVGALDTIREETTYAKSETNNQTTPNIHPTVLSPLTVLQSKTRAKLNFWPATTVVNRMRILAMR